MPPARIHVTDTYDVPDTDDADADTDDDAGPCEDIVVLAKTHSGASEDTYCGFGTLTMGHPWSLWVTHGKYGSPMVNMGHQGSDMVRYGPKQPERSHIAVSYTHLTLPTSYAV